jgi:hypothetical protein
MKTDWILTTQTELRIRHGILSQRASQKFPNNQFSHKSCREWPLLVDWLTNHFCHASHVTPARWRQGSKNQLFGADLGLMGWAPLSWSEVVPFNIIALVITPA